MFIIYLGGNLKNIHKVMLVLFLALAFVAGVSVGIWHGVSLTGSESQQETVFNKQELQSYIDNETIRIINAFEGVGFNVEEHQLVGEIGIYTISIENFAILGKSMGRDTIYLHWKTAFLRMPVFWMPFQSGDKAAILIYEPW